MTGGRLGSGLGEFSLQLGGCIVHGGARAQGGGPGHQPSGGSARWCDTPTRCRSSSRPRSVRAPAITLEGTNLQQLVEREGPQPAARVARILGQLAAAPEEMHEQGLVHRDIKPDNP
jgi:hypothetical protein